MYIVIKVDPTPINSDHERRSKEMFSYSDRTRSLIHKAAELDPALEKHILAIAESAFQDGVESEEF